CDCKIVMLQTVSGPIRGVVVAGVQRCGIHSVGIDRVEDQAVLSRDLVEPVILLMARRFPAYSADRLGSRNRNRDRGASADGSSRSHLCQKRPSWKGRRTFLAHKNLH